MLKLEANKEYIIIIIYHWIFNCNNNISVHISNDNNTFVFVRQRLS